MNDLIHSLNDDEYKQYIYDAIYPYNGNISILDTIRLWVVEDIQNVIAYHYICNRDDKKYVMWSLKKGYTVDKHLIDYYGLWESE